MFVAGGQLVTPAAFRLEVWIADETVGEKAEEIGEARLGHAFAP